MAPKSTLSSSLSSWTNEGLGKLLRVFHRMGCFIKRLLRDFLLKWKKCQRIQNDFTEQEMQMRPTLSFWVRIPITWVCVNLEYGRVTRIHCLYGCPGLRGSSICIPAVSKSQFSDHSPEGNIVSKVHTHLMIVFSEQQRTLSLIREGCLHFVY